MKFTELAIKGVFEVEPEPAEDVRGSFARSFCGREFRERGLEHEIRQSNISFNEKRGTLRGMHYRKEPHGEAKLVSCARGTVFDVVVDLRPSSPTFCRWAGTELGEGARMLYVPRGCAHGFQTLEDRTLVFYQMFEFYDPSFEAGARYDDKHFTIQWPLPVTAISEKDRSYPDFLGEAG